MAVSEGEKAPAVGDSIRMTGDGSTARVLNPQGRLRKVLTMARTPIALLVDVTAGWNIRATHRCQRNDLPRRVLRPDHRVAGLFGEAPFETTELWTTFGLIVAREIRVSFGGMAGSISYPLA